MAQGKLEFRHRAGDNDRHNVILLHGFGADSSDLYSLADMLDPEGLWNFYFPQAHLEVPIGPGWTGRGWFPISIRDLEAGVDFTKVRPPGMDEAISKVYDLIFDLNSEKLILGGFSQGAMVATEVAMRNPGDVQGLVLLSGCMIDQDNWTKMSSSLAGKPYIQSHGQRDQVIPIAAGQKLNDMLKNAGAEGSFITFGGAHEIPAPVLQKTKQFIESI